MKRGAFKIGNLSSESINAVIVSFPNINIPERNHTLNDGVFGMDRALLFDDESYANRKITFTVGFKESTESVETRIAKLLSVIDTGKYVDLIMYSDSEYRYKVVRSSSSSINRKMPNSDYRELVLEFSAAPYKYLIDSAAIPFGSEAKTIINPTPYTSFPYIKITGTGNIDLTINGKVYGFKNVSGSIELDSAMQSVWRMDAGKAVNENNKMKLSPFPTLEIGKNIISVKGGDAIIQPNWRTL
ncbi:hypothetical protein ACRHK7_01095 [Weissella tructae]|uniref:hypothetical protein n=1 Tax=Weissella tructae TaxID=887702 RepID=UPI003D92CF64